MGLGWGRCVVDSAPFESVESVDGARDCDLIVNGSVADRAAINMRAMVQRIGLIAGRMIDVKCRLDAVSVWAESAGGRYIGIGNAFDIGPVTASSPFPIFLSKMDAGKLRRILLRCNILGGIGRVRTPTMLPEL